MKERSDDAPKGQALTMTDRDEAMLREYAAGKREAPDEMPEAACAALLAELDATRARVAELERERDEAIRQARLSSLSNTPEWSEARSPEKLAELMCHMGYADGDSGYTFRYLSYAEMNIIRDALLDRAALAAREAECVEWRKFVGWLSTYQKNPPEIVKDDFAYDRLLLFIHDECAKQLSCPPGGTEALRAWGVKVARFYEEHRAEHTPEEVVARLLPPEPSPRVGEAQP